MSNIDYREGLNLGTGGLIIDAEKLFETQDQSGQPLESAQRKIIVIVCTFGTMKIG